ncbi:zinc-finger of mitochondrial splicing suppressor 51-domain-containing protein [Dichomitus squalens]|uniref:Zinc-finger of mitochondrial splicing suppressor 51-domain-containing protein n=1 Tax=Dichomitus squalens TaxID=114155 RepID=A0A4Q9N9U9_9APHY|nr:zinc-finger of mitochondrial splicing suppressor 51-domain-containing protein [Dichomitus squalens]
MLTQVPRRATRLLLAHSGRPSACLARSLPQSSLSSPLCGASYTSSRTFLSWFKSKPKDSPFAPHKTSGKDKTPVLSQDDLFHPFSKSPFPAIRARGEAIRQLAPCPVCAGEHNHGLHSHHGHETKAVSFECPDCGWPTHCSEEHWAKDKEHQKYCARLREVNEDEHDLRSGRRMREFELPGPQDSEAAISFANWDVFWYTREFPSMDSERSRRHASKILTYPITIGSVLHQFSNLTLSNQRLTPEGSRSLAALRTNLHVPPGAPETPEAAVTKPQMRIFILGARAESSLPPHVWEQLCMLFPSALFHLYFIGPQVSLPKPASEVNKLPKSSEAPAQSSTVATSESSSSSPNAKETTSEAAAASEQQPPTDPKEEKPVYLPNVYEPPTPAPIARLKRTRSSIEQYGVPSYTVPYTAQLTITGMQANYSEVHAQFQETFDPYTDCFFLFSPGLGFPSPNSVNEATGEPLLQVASPTEWGPVLPQLLATKCPIFVTGFSPADVERDVKSLSHAPDVAGEFDWVVTPGPNAFLSEKWEVADFDPRVMVKTNWGIWGIRGKRREVRERSGFLGLNL